MGGLFLFQIKDCFYIILSHVLTVGLQRGSLDSRGCEWSRTYKEYDGETGRQRGKGRSRLCEEG